MKQYIIKIKPHSNSSQFVYWNKDGKGFVHKESEASLLTNKEVDKFKNSAYYDEKNTTIISVKFSVRSM